MNFEKKLLISIALGILITGCGGGGEEITQSNPNTEAKDPLIAFKTQKIEWGSCDAYFSKYADPDMEYYSAMLGDRLQCADISAPLDYNNPEKATVKIAVLRVLSTKNSDKNPNLFFNPGGPGVDGQMYSIIYSSKLYETGNKNTPLGSTYQKMAENFNLVGFSPRGVGESTTISCSGNEYFLQIDYTKNGNNPDNIKSITNYAKAVAKNCQKSPVSDYINTDATARDMDLIRHLLGDEKMHYYGKSYGTWLGFWYAGIFPDKVGPMVLDSNMNFSRPMTEAAILYKEGQIKTFENFQAPYFARHDDILGLGNSKEIVLSNINNMTDFAKNNLPLWLYRAEPNSIFLNIAIIQTAFEISNMQKQNYPINQIRAAIQEAKYIKNDAIMEQFKSGVQKHFLDALSQYANPQPPQVQKFNEGDPVFNTVVCNDEAISNTDPVFWFSTGFKLAARLPIINAHVAMQPCLYWKRNEAFSKPKMSSLQSAKLLMVQSEFDVPTPLSGAMETFNQLPATSMVYVTNEGSHGLQLYGTECVDLTVINYLLGQAPANRMTQCQGKPMALDAQTAQNQTVASSQSKASRTTRASSTSATTVSDETSNFEDPVLAQELLNRLRTAGSASLH